MCLDHRFRVPFGRAAIPVIQADLAAEVQHQRFERRRRIELEAHRVQFFFGRAHFRLEATQIFHQHQRMLLFFEEPHAHEGGEIAVVMIVAQEHFRCGQRRPFGDRVHLDRCGLLIGQERCIERVPGNVFLHVPSNGFERFIKFRIKHGVHSPTPVLRIATSVCVFCNSC
jgi:hypothetical protein